jgi:uncharacterized membrane protein
LRAALLTTSMAHGVLLGGLFGLAFGLFFAHRCSSPGSLQGFCPSWVPVIPWAC